MWIKNLHKGQTLRDLVVTSKGITSIRRLCACSAFCILVVVVISALTSLPTVAANRITGTIVRDADEPFTEPYPFVIPYAISTEAMGFSVGVLGGISGKPQEQNSLFITALVSDGGAKAAYLFFNDYQTHLFNDRLFLDASIGAGDFPEIRGYFDVGPPADPPFGSNESPANAFFESSGYTDWAEVDLRYVFAAGSAKYNPINIYTLNRGLLVGGASGGEPWNPLVSGRSYMGVKFFYHDRVYNYADDIRLTTTGARLTYNYDNTDFPINPERGSRLNLAISRDPGSGSTDAWTTVNAQFSKYIPLSTGAKTKQRVIALDFWTADTLSDDMAPPNYGISLGGLYRLRAYPAERFYDRAAIYYAVEFRVIPKSDLLRNIKFLKFLNLQWWEIVTFYELGRVAPDWDFSTLHSDMKSDFGMGIRVLMGRTIGRMDFAYSDEDRRLWLMIGHPF